MQSAKLIICALKGDIMTTRLFLSLALAFGVAACESIPYRADGYAEYPECRKLYEEHDDISGQSGKVDEAVLASRCWLRASEERRDYDLLTIEFDDQGWVQSSSPLERPAGQDFLDEFFGRLHRIYDENRENGLSLVVYIHGWHHNARATDSNVTDFRWLLRDLAIAEKDARIGASRDRGPRVVGVYVGWRGESITVPYLNEVTFWERKNTAERVAQGSVRELFARLDFLRDAGRTKLASDRLSQKDDARQGERNVRMLTIGHSFGGLIAYEALSSEFVRFASRSTPEDYVSRLGDLVVIVNPAFEGARYEPLMVAGQRLRGLKKNQLPVVIVATSEKDNATGILFPIARVFSTLFEGTNGPEGRSVTRAVGHNERYTTHRLKPCDEGDKECDKACLKPQTTGRKSSRENLENIASDMSEESRLMRGIADKGFAGLMSRDLEYLCGRLRLESTKMWSPKPNPFWVVSTTGEVMKDHNDIFNPRFVSFIRQMYLGVIEARFR